MKAKETKVGMRVRISKIRKHRFVLKRYTGTVKGLYLCGC